MIEDVAVRLEVSDARRGGFRRSIGVVIAERGIDSMRRTASTTLTADEAEALIDVLWHAIRGVRTAIDAYEAEKKKEADDCRHNGVA